MAKRKSEYKDLPPKMIPRKRILKSGKEWIGYYYDGRVEGKRVEIPLGSDLNIAKRKWAELEQIEQPETEDIKYKKTLAYLFDKYEKEIIPTKASRTQDDNKYELKFLRKAFSKAPINDVQPKHIAQYRDARTAKTRGNREMALLSHIYNTAIEWGLADKNPVTGVRKNKESKRRYYATDEVFFAIYKKADQCLKNAMLLAYLIGQRPSDVLKIKKVDISNDYLFLDQGKTEQRLRIKLNNNNDQRNGLGTLIDELLVNNQTPYLITNNGKRVSLRTINDKLNNVKGKLSLEAEQQGNTAFAEQVKSFLFKDIRPKSASDISDRISITEASKLLGHTNEQITHMVYDRIGKTVEPLVINVAEINGK